MIVIPGEKILDKIIKSDYVYVKDGKSYAAVIGMVNEGKFVPLEGAYKPKIGDLVVGVVVDARFAGYSIDINMPQEAFIPSRDLDRFSLKLGNVIQARIKDIEKNGKIVLTDVRILPKGKLVEFPIVKIPRLLGRNLSMINTIKTLTKTNIIAANNGYVWISETGNIPLVLQVLNMIKSQAHTHGLTDRVKEFLEQKVKE